MRSAGLAFQNDQELAKFAAARLDGGGFGVLRLAVKLKFALGLCVLSVSLVGQGEAVVCLGEHGLRRDRPLIRGNGGGRFASCHIERPELHVRLGELGVKRDSLFEQSLRLLDFRCASLQWTSRILRLLDQTDGVIVVGERIARLRLRESRQFFLGAWEWDCGGLLDFSKKQIGSRRARTYIRSLAKAAGRFFRRAAGVKSSPEPSEHSGRGRMGLRAVRKYFNGRPWRAVHQQLRAPVKVILLAGVRANGKLEFAHRANRVAGALRGFPPDAVCGRVPCRI